MKNILFFAPFSEENIKLMEVLSQDNDVTGGFWKTKALDDFSINPSFCFDEIGETMSKKLSIISSSPQEAIFIEDIKYFLNKYGFSPDTIIVKGLTSDMWAFAVIHKVFSLDPCFLAILESVSLPVTEFDKDIFDQFDKILGLNFLTLSETVDQKTKELFHIFDPSLFRNLLEFGLYNEIEGSMLVVTNSENYDFIVDKLKNKENISIINGFICPQEELVIYLNIHEYVVDCTECEEFGYVLSRMGKISISWKEFEDSNFNYNIGEDFYLYKNYRKNLVKFCEYLKKGICDILENYKSRIKVVNGTDIQIEEK